MKKRYPFLLKNWLRVGLAAAIFTSFSFDLKAQNGPVKQWDKTFGGSAQDELHSLQQTTDGGYILGGWSASGISGEKSQPSKGDRDYWIVKLDANGTKLWDKTIGGSDDDRFTSLQQTTDGGYILGGSSNSSISGDKSQANKGTSPAMDFWIVKLDANGNKTWDKTFGGSAHDELKKLEQTTDGGYILGGFSYSGISGDKTQVSKGNQDYWLVKLDTNGNKLWDKTYGSNGFDSFKCIKQTSDGGYIIGGDSDAGISGDKTQASKGDSDYWILRLDGNGNKLWDKAIGGDSIEYLTSIRQTSDGGFIAGGFSYSNNSFDKSQHSNGKCDYWIVKLDPNGNKIWDSTIGGINEDNLICLQQTPDGGFIASGNSKSGISGDKTQISYNYDLWVVKLNANGNVQWEKTFSGTNDYFTSSLEQIGNGDYLFGGFIDSGITSDKSQNSKGGIDYWIIRTDGVGNRLWDKTVGSTGNDFLYAMQRTADNGFILGGLSATNIGADKTQASKGGNDFWIIKLATDYTGIKEPEANSNISIFPNPNQGKFNLQLRNISTPTAEVTISDLLGRIVLKKVIQKTNNQLSEELILPNAKGMYLLQLKVGEQIVTRKIVVE